MRGHGRRHSADDDFGYTKQHQVISEALESAYLPTPTVDGRTGHAQSTVDRVIGVCAGGFRGWGHAIPQHLGVCSILTAPARCLAPPKYPPAQAQRASQPPLNGKWCTSGIKNFWVRTCRYSLSKLKECLKLGVGHRSRLAAQLYY
jgi:hypothetical protein